MALAGESSPNDHDAAINAAAGRAPGSEDPAGAALAAAQLGEWAHDLLTGQVSLSGWARQLLGLPECGAISIEDLEACRHPDDRAAFQAARSATLADPTRGFIRQSYRIQRPDRSVRWIESRGTIFRDPEGRAVRLLGVMLDVTDRHEREQWLEQSWRRFEAALANTAIAVFEQDRDLRYTWIHNPPMGYEAHRIVGKTDREVMGSDYAADVTAKKRRVLETGAALQTEVVVPLARGSGRFDLHIEPLRDSGGQIVGIACAGIELAKTVLGTRRNEALHRTIADRDLLLDKVIARLDPRQRHRSLLPLGISALARKLGVYVELRAEDHRLLEALHGRCRYVATRQPLVPPETDDDGPRLLGNGWAYSYSLLADGRRQVIGFHLPGDVIGLWGLAAGNGVRRAVATASDCVVCDLDRTVLDRILHSETRLAEALHRAAAIEVAITEQHLVSIGRRSAEARLAHLLLELDARLEILGLAAADGYRCPLTQELIADALGLTNVHVNRLLRRWRDQGLLTFVRGFVAFKDKPRLIERAEYDPGFLGTLEARQHRYLEAER